MRKIQMVDLHSQYEKIKPQIDSAIQDVIDSTAFVRGDKVRDFQSHLEQYLGVKHVIPVGNGTDALQIALMALDFRSGDEIIVPAFTFIASAEVIALLGLTPVLSDVDMESMNMSTDTLERLITPRTRAIIPVHLFGQNADMEPILEIAKRYGLYVVEDACQSIGAEYIFSDRKRVKSGCMGDIGCTSFFPSKNLGCYGDGGALFTNDDVLADKIRMIANHGMLEKYHHDMIGVNSRLDTMQAAVLDVKLRYLDEYNRARQKAAEYYDNKFADVPYLTTPHKSSFSTHVYHQYTLRVKGYDRDLLREKLAKRGIPSMVYYPIPIHLQKAYGNGRYAKGDFPVAEELAESVVSLPIHTELDEEQLSYITENVIDILNNG